MKKNMFSALALAAIVSATLTTGCSKDGTIGNSIPGTEESRNTTVVNDTSPSSHPRNGGQVRFNQDFISGSVTGVVFPVPKSGEIEIVDASGVVAQTKTDASGRFTVDKLMPANYAGVIRYLSNKKGKPVYKVKKIQQVMIEAGQTTDLGVIIAQ